MLCSSRCNTTKSDWMLNLQQCFETYSQFAKAKSTSNTVMMVLKQTFQNPHPNSVHFVQQSIDSLRKKRGTNIAKE